ASHTSPSARWVSSGASPLPRCGACYDNRGKGSGASSAAAEAPSRSHGWGAQLASAAMCGICGLVSLDGGAVDAAPLAAMNEALRHRGPDSEGCMVDGPVALAARRLSIIELEGGDQPIGNEDGS